MKINISKILYDFLEVAKKHQFETILSAVATLTFFIFDLHILKPYFVYYVFSVICFGVIYLLNGTKIYKILPIFMACFYLFLYVNDEKISEILRDNYTKLILFYLALILAMLSRSFGADDVKFVKFAFKTMTSMINAGFILLSVYVIICGLLASIEYLFGIDFILDTYYKVFFILFFSVFPMLFLYFDSKFYDIKVGFVFKILLNIVEIALIFYTALLYAYLFYIIFNAELPRGMLSVIIIVYIYISILFYALRLIHVGKFHLYFKWFGFISIAPLIMLFVGIFRRISDYGYTIDRIYLLGFSILAALLCLLCIFKFRLRTFSFVTIFTLLFLIFGVDMKRISYDSQSQKLNEILVRFNAIEINGTINMQKVYKIDKKELNRVKNIIHTMKTYGFKRADEKLFEGLIKWSKQDDKYVSHSFVLHQADEFAIKTDDRKIIYATSIIYNDNNDSKKDFIMNDSNKYEIFTFEGDEFISDVFVKNGLDINKIYEYHELNKYKNDFLTYKTQNGTMIFSNITINFDINAQRYKFLFAQNAIFIQKDKK